MAIVTFGSTTRGASASAAGITTGIGIKNTSTSNLAIGLMHGVVLVPGATKYLTFNELDDRLRYNPRNGSMNIMNSGGPSKPYLDDINEFAKLIAAGTVQVYTATQNVSSATFTGGVTAAYSVYGDGSVVFS